MGEDATAGFTGFKPAAMRFFRDLAENQDRDWFAAHKATYEEAVHQPLAHLVVALSERFEGDGLPLRGDPKRSLFRINRDVRFSADKRPYNTHASAALTRDGDKQSPGVFYLQFAPADSFAAAGFFRPDADTLHRMRQGLAADPKGWARMIATLAAAKLAMERDDTLVRVPRGFEGADDATADDLKLKSWIVRRPVSAAEMSKGKLVDTLADFATTARSLLEFGWKALAARR